MKKLVSLERPPRDLNNDLPLKQAGSIPPNLEVGTGGAASPAVAESAVMASIAADRNVEAPKRRFACGTNHAEVGSTDADDRLAGNAGGTAGSQLLG